MISKALLTSNTDERSTPEDLFNKLNKYFKFTLDPASTNENAKTKKHFTKEEDGLKQDRSNEIVRLNPPYGRTIGQRIKKAYEESQKNSIIIMLLPARTDTKRFNDYIYYNDNANIFFIKGRLKFGNSKNSAPFPSMIVSFNYIGSLKILLNKIL